MIRVNYGVCRKPHGQRSRESTNDHLFLPETSTEEEIAAVVKAEAARLYPRWMLMGWCPAQRRP